MSISQNFPEIAPSLNLDFANVKALDPRVTFARASGATYYGTQTAKAEENLLLQSQFASGWAIFSTAALTPNNTTAPDGTTTAALLSSPATEDYVYRVTTIVVGKTYVYSVFVKNSTATVSRLFVRFADTNATVKINWSGATLTSLTELAGISADFVSVGNDWYRVSVTFTALETTPRFRVYSGDNDSSTGDIFAWGAQLEQRDSVTAYTPTTTQPITRYQPVLESATDNVARFDHDPVTGESLGLLVEEQRTNFTVRSEEFINVVYTKGNSTVTANTIIAPDGTLSGSKLVATATSGFHNIYQTYTLADSGTYTAAWYVKPAEETSVTLNLRSDSFTNGFSCTFNLSALTTSGQANGTGTFISAEIKSVGNGWYRIIATGTIPSGTSVTQQLILRGASYTGDGFSGIYIWGAQLEEGAFPTSYIKTEASQVTRSADAASMTGANFSSWYRQDEGTFYGETTFIAGDIRQVFQATISATTGSNDIGINSTSAFSNPRLRINVNSVNQAEPNVTLVANTPFKAAGAYKVNNVNIGVNGLLGTLATNATLPVVDQLFIGQRANGSRFLNTTIRKLSFYPKRLSDVQLQGLTS